MLRAGPYFGAKNRLSYQDLELIAEINVRDFILCNRTCQDQWLLTFIKLANPYTLFYKSLANP